MFGVFGVIFSKLALKMLKLAQLLGQPGVFLTLAKASVGGKLT